MAEERLTYADEHAMRERDGETWPDRAAAISDRRALLAELDALRADLARVTGERDDERAKANEWLAQAHDARAQLAALHAAIGAARFEAQETLDARRDVLKACESLVDALRAIQEAHRDTAAAAKAYKARVREPVERERDAAIVRAEAAETELAEVRAFHEKIEAAARKSHDVTESERDEARTLLSVARGLAEEAGVEAKAMREQRDTLAAALAEHRRTVADVLAEPHAYIGARERAVLGALAASPVELAAQPLPVLRTCGECGWVRGSTTHDGPTLFCGQSVPERPLHRGPEPEPPPSWCPLRGAR